MRGKRGENAAVPSAPHMAKSCHAIVILWLDRLAQRSRRLIGVPRFNVQVQVTLCARHKYGYLWDSLSPDQIWCFQLLTTPRDCGTAVLRPTIVHRSRAESRLLRVHPTRSQDILTASKETIVVKISINPALQRALQRLGRSAIMAYA